MSSLIDPPFPQLINLTRIVDERGELTVGEIEKSLPFVAQRFFYISKVPEGEPRGIHAHKECHQLLVCLAGELKAMVDDGINREVVTLRNDGVGLHMPPLTWGAQYDYSEDAVLLVLASQGYDPEDYIHEYVEFLAFVN